MYCVLEQNTEIQLTSTWGDTQNFMHIIIIKTPELVHRRQWKSEPNTSKFQTFNLLLSFLVSYFISQLHFLFLAFPLFQGLISFLWLSTVTSSSSSSSLPLLNSIQVKLIQFSFCTDLPFFYVLISSLKSGFDWSGSFDHMVAISRMIIIILVKIW